MFRKNRQEYSHKNIYQGCVKDILDEVNELKKGSKELPKSRFVAEPTKDPPY